MGQTAFHKGNFPGSLADKEISLSPLFSLNSFLVRYTSKTEPERFHTDDVTLQKTL